MEIQLWKLFQCDDTENDTHEAVPSKYILGNILMCVIKTISKTQPKTLDNLKNFPENYGLHFIWNVVHLFLTLYKNNNIYKEK